MNKSLVTFMVIFIIIILLTVTIIWFNANSTSSVPDYIKEQRRILSEGLPSSVENFNFEVPAGALPEGVSTQADRNPFSGITYFCGSGNDPRIVKRLISICDICQDDKVIATTNLPQEKQAKIKEIFSFIKNQLNDPDKTRNLDMWRVCAAFSSILGVLIAFIAGGNMNINDPEINAKLETLSILQFYNNQEMLFSLTMLRVVLPQTILKYYERDNLIIFNNYKYNRALALLGMPSNNSGYDTDTSMTPAQFRTFYLSFFTQEQIRDTAINNLDGLYNKINRLFVTNKVFLQAPATCNEDSLISNIRDIIDPTAF